ncbi:MAG TPA: hypothetical protein VFF32_04330 [Dermatophilaceae bacterium]|nr:hypothetical protein [Dermatophilaceae bacterium]
MIETELQFDPALLGLAHRVLKRRGFLVREGALRGLADAPWLLAESDDFVLAVVAGRGIADLELLESHAAPELGEMLAQGDLGPKRWDAYLVLMASGDSDERGNREVVDLQYNTRALRRIVALGVSADEEAVLSVLATFMPLPDPPSADVPHFSGELSRRFAGGSLGLVEGVQGSGFDVGDDGA